jgi:hypothetical protein
VRCRWLDDEGDLVTLKSVEGMEEALHVCGCKLRLHVSVRRTSPVSIQACHAATWFHRGAGDTHEMRVCQAPRTCGRTFRVCAASSYLCREPTSTHRLDTVGEPLQTMLEGVWAELPDQLLSNVPAAAPSPSEMSSLAPSVVPGSGNLSSGSELDSAPPSVALSDTSDVPTQAPSAAPSLAPSMAPSKPKLLDAAETKAAVEAKVNLKSSWITSLAQKPAGGSARSSAAGESTTHPDERVRPCVLHSIIDRGRFDVLRFHQSPGGDVSFLREVDTSRRYRVW